MKKNGLLIVLIFFAIVSQSQTYSFRRIVNDDNFEIQPYGNEIYCLYRISEKKDPRTSFKKVFLDSMLSPVHEEVYELEGKAKLLASCSDESYVTHAFYSKSGSVDKLLFVVTDHQGKMVSTFTKTAADLSRYLQKPIKNLKNFRLGFIPNNGSPGELLIQPYRLNGAMPLAGSIFCLNATDGSERWMSSVPPLSNIQATGSLLIGLLRSEGGYGTVPAHQIYFIDKSNGNLIRSVRFDSKIAGYRQISVFTTNGLQLMVAGSEFESANTKNGKFFMTMYNLDGEKIFDKVDSASRLSTKRLYLLGHVFDQDGNLVLVGESWKYDATSAIVSTGMSILLAATVGGYPSVYGNLDHKIDHVVFATLSPIDGGVKSFRSFPVGPWLNHGQLMTQGGHVLISIANNVIMYNTNNPDQAPAPFTSLKATEDLILTPYGALVKKRDGKNYTLSWLQQ